MPATHPPEDRHRGAGVRIPTALPRRPRLGLTLARAFLAGGADLSARGVMATWGVVPEYFYGAHRDERLDVLEPRPVSAHSHADPGSVVFIHGGGWVVGRKEIYLEPLVGLADRGHRVFNLEYPLAPERPHPFMLRSLLKALRWIGRNHPDTGPVHLIGDSAGGNLAMMLAILISNPDLLDSYDPGVAYDGPAIRSLVSIYGVLDRLSWVEDGFPFARSYLRAYGGPGALAPQVTQATAITPLDIESDVVLPPTLLAVGTKDHLARSSRLAAARFGAVSDSVTLVEYSGARHGFYTAGPRRTRLRADVAAFLAEH